MRNRVSVAHAGHLWEGQLTHRPLLGAGCIPVFELLGDMMASLFLGLLG